MLTQWREGSDKRTSRCKSAAGEKDDETRVVAVVVVPLAENGRWDIWFRRRTVMALGSEDGCFKLKFKLVSMLNAVTVAARRPVLCQ